MAVPSSLPCTLFLSVSKEARFEGNDDGFLISEGAVRVLELTGVVLNSPPSG